MYDARMRRLLVLTLTGAGCFHPSPPSGAPCNDRDECPSGQSCFSGYCYVPGTEPDAAIDACPDSTCLGNDLAGCGSRITCALGCSAVTVAHCETMVPSNNVSPSLLAGAVADLAGDKFDFDTDDGGIRAANVTIRANGTGVISGIGFTIQDGMGIFTFNSLSSTVSDNWSGHGANSLVLFAATTITLAGDLDLGANANIGGTGGFDGGASLSVGTGCRGRGGSWTQAQIGEGGGGGGGRTAGGNGAPSNGATFGAGGAMCTNYPSITPLRGGNGGGAAGVDAATSPDTVHGGVGGGGGGAVALVAMESIMLSGTASIAVPGGGGETAASGDGGGGGGGGGAILIESPVVTVSGALTANGGGGAGPGGTNGSRGHTTDGNAAGAGSFTGPGGTRTGGRGGTGALSPTTAQTYTYDDGLALPTSITARGGGGGGAAGKVTVKSRSPMLTGSTQSPSAVVEDIVVQ